MISAGLGDIFITKYYTSGNLQWVQSAGGKLNDSGISITLDSAKNVYVTGRYSDIAAFGAIIKSSVGGNDIFIAKYNSGGTLQWVQSAGGTLDDAGNSVAVDAYSNVYVTGAYKDTATFGATSKTSAGGSDVFLARISQ